MFKIDEKGTQKINITLEKGKTFYKKNTNILADKLESTKKHDIRLYILKPNKIESNVCGWQILKKIDKIIIFTPKYNFDSDRCKYVFNWSDEKGKKAVYTIDFYKKPACSNSIFRLTTKNTLYNVNLCGKDKIFKPGENYYFSIKGFDIKNRLVSKSTCLEIAMPQKKYVKGQIIAAASYKYEIPAQIMKKDNIKIIGLFKLHSLKIKIYLLKTAGSIFSVIRKLKTNKNIIDIQPNYILTPLSDDKPFKSYIGKFFDLYKVHKHYTGDGVSVAVVDTGVDFKHKDLRNNIKYHENFVFNDAYKPENHGTAMAGIIASYGDLNTGIAPNAKIIALRACQQQSNKKGECYSLSVAMAIDKAIEEKADIVNMSFCSKSDDKLIEMLIKAGHRKNIAFVAPAGNNHKQKYICFPASDRFVISVCGYDRYFNPYPNNKVEKQSNILAPSSFILSTFPNNEHGFIRGTSVSSAIVSGILALYKQKFHTISPNLLLYTKQDVRIINDKLLSQ